MKIIITKNIIEDNEWGTPEENTFFIYHTFSSFEKAKKECMKNFNSIYHYYDKYERYNPYGLFYIPSIRKEKTGIRILFAIYSKNASWEDVVGDEREPFSEIAYELIDVSKLPCD